MSQEDFMKKDECILCDENDVVIGSSSKYDAHVFDNLHVSVDNVTHREFNIDMLRLCVYYIVISATRKIASSLFGVSLQF